MGKLPSQPEYIQKESCQAITLRSGKEVDKNLNKKKGVDDEVVGIEANSEKNVDECANKGKKGNANPPKEDEPKVDLRTLPFP